MTTLRSEPSGVPRFSTLVEALQAAPPDLPFVTMWTDEDDIHSATFGEFIRAAQSQAAGLHQHGVASGDRVILIMPQGIPLMTTFVGAMYLGAVPAILPYPNSKADPAKYRSGLMGVSQNLTARLTVVDEAFSPDLLTHVALDDGAQLVRSDRLFVLLPVTSHCRTSTFRRMPSRSSSIRQAPLACKRESR